MGFHPKLYDLNTYPPDQTPYPVTDKRSSESQLFIEALEDSQNPLSIIPDADVRRGALRKTRRRTECCRQLSCEHAHRFGKKALFRSKWIWTGPRHIGCNPCAYRDPGGRALGSPTILLRSGVANDQIGHGVILHPSMPVIGKFNRTIDVLEGTQASVYADDHLIDRGYAFESMSANPEYGALMSPGPAMHTLQVVRSYKNLAGFGVMLIDTVSPDNRLYLDENGEPHVHYQLSEADKRRFRKGVAEAVRMMFLAGASEVYLPTTENILGATTPRNFGPSFSSSIRQAHQVEKNLQFIPNRSIVTSAHMQATDKMGASPLDSVVGRDFHVWGTTGLYVVDGSVFPTSIGANPMQSIYTFAKIFADRLTEKHSCCN